MTAYANDDKPTIGIIFPGDSSDPRTWSGTPSGVAQGLAASGVNVTHVSVSLPPTSERIASWLVALFYLHRVTERKPAQRARFAVHAAMISPALMRLRARAARGRLAEAGCDGYIQIGASFPLPTDAPVVTYEDMTVTQALDYPYAHWSALRRGDVRWRIAKQRSAYGAARACCVTNSWAREAVIRDYGMSPDKVHVAGVGTNQEPRQVSRDWSVPRFLFVGREWERKNGPRVVDAFVRLREQYPEAELHVVGGHPPLDVAGVTTYGALRQDEPAEKELLQSLFDRATCFVMPSLFEPSAIVYTEAAAAGIPSIGTVVGGSQDLIGDAGIAVDPTDSDAIYEAMHRLADPSEAQAYAQRAEARSPLFVWPRVAERLLRALAVTGRSDLAAYLPLKTPDAANQ